MPAHRCTPDDGDNLTGTSPTLGGGGDTLARRGLRVVFAVGAALAVTLATTTDGKVWAAGDDAVVSEESPRAAAAASLADGEGSAGVKAGVEEAEEEAEVVEMLFDDVEVGRAPDLVAQKNRVAERTEKGLTELEQKAVENNQRIKTYNNAPAEFPTFVREGYDVKCITAPGFVTQDDGLVYKDFIVGEGATPEDGQEVTFNYTAYNESGGTIDSTYRKNVPASTRLGIKGMIPGFEEGLKGMKEGGRRRVVVPPELGPPIGPATFFSSKQWEVGK